MPADLELLRKCKQDFDTKLPMYMSMQKYYDGHTEAMEKYKMITKRANTKVRCNFIQKFINEEASYCCGNKVTYSSHSSNADVIEDIRLNFKHWKEKHNKELCKQSLIFNEAYELYYIDSNGLFNSLICTPLDSYILKDDYSNIILFIRFWTRKFDSSGTLYADVYTTTDIGHYTVIGDEFTPIIANVLNSTNSIIKSNNNDINSFSQNAGIGPINNNIDANIFGQVPVSVVQIGTIDESLFSILKGLQDGFETNLSDMVNEISDFRNAYLAFKGCKLDDTTKDENGETDLDKMKRLGVMNLPGDKADAKWLIKEINDSFVQNTLNTLEDKMYQLASHINNNEKLVSNTSSLALRNRLIGLEEKCTNNIQALVDAIKVRLQFLFIYLQIKQNKDYDWKDIDIKIVPNIPTDDLMMSQIISQLNGKLSLKTGLAQLSFVDNVDNEMAELKKENEADSVGQSLLNGGGIDENKSSIPQND
ncbi:phage portal protein [Clostridium coskatii]|uniref:Phage portal protein, SPP1 Gp6-like n=1 Tax=Clostridium coskatii TaxID=1705578 RepID=A0A166RDZ9_9CLOT|nr:phage portal protein [Clostridium coskatii]OAA90717.1 Phage portal protein, SPP1 Gp6-like protein [Clostridium coskatii]OBR97447.1 phage portal protein, SPP1 Gp6-like [Clostridium coskatii]